WPHPRQRAWVEVNEAALEANARSLRRSLAPGSALMAVVKADGYGHGAVPVARAAAAGGASCFGVATLQEGVELRQAGLQQPVLVLGNLTHPEELRACLHWQLMPTLSGMREALLCQNLAAGSGRPLAVHLKLDTGMARLGAPWQEGQRLVEAIASLEAVDLAGLYSHLADADAPGWGLDPLTQQQQQRFDAVLTGLQQAGLSSGSRHLANSAATLRSPQLHYDLVRVGLALYGHRPAAHLGDALALQPAMQVRARVSLMRTVPAGVGVSYGHRFTTSRPSRLAVVGIGYADGVPRLLSNRLQVLFRGRPVPQVGAITMDQLVLDATDVPELDQGAVVTLLGEDGGARIDPLAWSEPCGTIPWEILCGFKHRLPRLPCQPPAEADPGGQG
uniref:alanine racemase n=1 Tax=Vulcanococcus sp. TaxID=2856995 RepID=UPI0037DA5A16